MFRTSPLLLALFAATGTLVSAQSAADIGGIMNQLVVVIPESCLDVCSPWQTALQQCPVDTSTDYSTCTCDASFIANFNACTGCMANQFTTDGDTVNGPVATSAPGDLQTYCANEGAVVVSSTSTDALTTSSTSSLIEPTTTTSSTSIAESTTSTDSSMTSSTMTTAAPAVTTPAVAGGAFPSQTKSANVFANDASSSNNKKVTVGIVLGMIGAGLVI